VDAWHHGWQAGHDELCAWALDPQASIALYKNRPRQALATALQGAQQAPANHYLAVRFGMHAARAYARLRQREDFDAALREALDRYERLPARPPTHFGLDTRQLAAYAVTSYAASSCNWLDLPEQARRHATDALDLLTAAPEKDRSPDRGTNARIDLALALVPLGSPDEACGLGHQALSGERVVYSVRARALELDAALQRNYADSPKVREFHERCRLLAQSSTPRLMT
jgi:hypothetical protein